MWPRKAKPEGVRYCFYLSYSFLSFTKCAIPQQHFYIYFVGLEVEPRGLHMIIMPWTSWDISFKAKYLERSRNVKVSFRNMGQNKRQ